jgi:hypothetical protein
VSFRAILILYIVPAACLICGFGMIVIAFLTDHFLWRTLGAGPIKLGDRIAGIFGGTALALAGASFLRIVIQGRFNWLGANG